MADTSKQPFPWPLLLTALLTLGGGLTWLHPLNPARPRLELPPVRGSGQQDVPARLWQDPFKVVYDHLSLKLEDDKPRLDELRASIRGSAAEPDFSKSLMILPVMLPGANYSESTEQRMRARFAVLSALAVGGYESVNVDNIGYVDLSPPASAKPYGSAAKGKADSPDNPLNSPLLVPFEFVRRSNLRWPMKNSVERPLLADPGRPGGSMRTLPFEEVLILWVNENKLGERPCYTLDQMIHRLVAAPTTQPQASGGADVAVAARASPGSLSAKPVVNSSNERVQVHIIGPRASTSLREMAEELASPLIEPVSPLPLSFYCPTATAEAAAIRGDDVSQATRASDLSDLFSFRTNAYRGWSFVRTTLDDQILCKTLINELELRGLSVRSTAAVNTEPAKLYQYAGTAEVAIVSEWDTFYGRALAATFKAECANTPTTQQSVVDSRATNVHNFWYLRGIDGQAAGETRATGQAENKAADNSKTPPPDDRPEGTNQSDYLRRLADRMMGLQDELRKRGKRLKAIGVLGSDVYDKLMVLRALRDRLPEAIYFTSEMDARYSLRSEYDAARNLIVATPFACEAHPYYQLGTPPFRDSQQTATFYATLTALGFLDPSTFLKKGETPLKQEPSLGLPRIFEIGRAGAVDLSSDADPATVQRRMRDVGQGQKPETLQVIRQNLDSDSEDRIGVFSRRTTRWMALAGIGALFAWGLILIGTVRKLILSSHLRLNVLTALMAVAVFAVFFRICYECLCADAEKGNQFSLDGTSVWPTEMLRLLVIVGGPALIVWAYHEVKALDARLCTTFALTPASPSFFSFSRSFRHVANLCRLATRELFAITSSGVTIGNVRKWVWRWTPSLSIDRWQVYAEFATPRVGAMTPSTPRQIDCVEWDAIKNLHGVRQFQVVAQHVWDNYNRCSNIRVRMVRVVIGTLLYLLAAAAVVSLLGSPFNPVRGPVTQNTDFIMLALSVVVATLIYFYILDIAFLNTRLINHLNRTPTRWPDGAYQAIVKNLQLVRPAPLNSFDLTEFLDVEFIAQRTRVIARSIYLPFGILLVMLLSRSRVLFNWDWPFGLIFLFTINAVLASGGALMLRFAAERCRTQALRSLRERRLQFLMQDDTNPSAVGVVTNAKDRAAAVEKLEQMVRDERRGAFSILSSYPTLLAILLPSGSLALTALFDFLLQLAA